MTSWSRLSRAEPELDPPQGPTRDAKQTQRSWGAGQRRGRTARVTRGARDRRAIERAEGAGSAFDAHAAIWMTPEGELSKYESRHRIADPNHPRDLRSALLALRRQGTIRMVERGDGFSAEL